MALAYGVGFGAAGLLDGRVDRIGPARLLVPAVLALVAVHGLVPPAAGSLSTVLVLAVAWGLVNHLGLSLLVGLSSVAGGPARGAVMALHSGVTHLAASPGTAGLGPLHERHGLPVVALVSAGALLLAAPPACAGRPPRLPRAPDRPQSAAGSWRPGCGDRGRRW